MADDIKKGIKAAKNSDLEDFVSRAEDVFGTTPEPSETTQEEVKAEPETTVAGLSGAVTRGVSPYAAGALAAAPLGLAAGPFAPIGVPGAMAVGAGTVALSEAFTPLVNKALGTNMATPREAMNALLDWAGVAKPTSKTEKILEKVSDVAASTAGVTGTLGTIAKAVPATYGTAKGVLTALGEAPTVQAIGAGTGVVAGEKAKEYAKEKGMPEFVQTGAEFGGQIAGAAPVAALSAISPAVTRVAEEQFSPAVKKALQILKPDIFVKPAPEIITKFPERLIPTTKKAIEGDKQAQIALAESAAATTPEITESLGKLGFKVEEVPTQFTSISPEYQSIVQRATKAPGSELDIQQQQFLDQLKTKAGEITSKAGGTEDLSSLSNEIRTSMLDQIKDLDAKDDVLYGAIRKIAKPETETDLSNALNAVKEKLRLLGGDKGLLSPIERQIFDSLSPKPIINEIGEQVGIKNPTIEAIRTLKSKVGSILQGEKTFPNETIGNAKYYYGKLSDDYIGSIEPILQERGAGGMLEFANNIVKQRKSIEDNAINLFGDELSQSISSKISRAGETAAKGDADAIQNILKSVPDQYKPEIVGSAIRGAVTKEGEFNIENFVKWYGGLKEQKESYKALFGNLDPSVSQEMDSLYTISKNVSDSLGAKLRPSESAQITQKSLNIAQKIKNLTLSGLIGVATYKTLGAVGIHGGMDAIISSILSGTVARHTFSKSKQEIMGAVDEFLTSKQFADLVAKSKGDPNVFSRMSSEIENLPAYKKFSKKVGPEIAKRALQAPMMSDDQVEQQPEQ